MAAAYWGTNVLADLLQSKFPNIREYGFDRAFDDVKRALEAWNMVVRDLLEPYVEYGTERIMGYAGNQLTKMVKTGEFGRAAPQKTAVSGTIAFPLFRSEYSMQWTEDWLEQHTPQELAEQFMGAQNADVLEIQTDVRTALFSPTNRTVLDKLKDGLSLPVKALANADGAPIPTAPNGTVFDGSTHTHYTPCATPGTPIAADINSLLTNVSQHFNAGKLMLGISLTDLATLTAMTGTNQFIPLQPVQVLSPTTGYSLVGASLDTSQTYNRHIGIWGTQAAEVWVKPWVPPGYMIAWMTGQRKVLYFREMFPGSGILRMVSMDRMLPLTCQLMKRDYGIGVQNRIGAAALDLNNGSYTLPASL